MEFISPISFCNVHRFPCRFHYQVNKIIHIIMGTCNHLVITKVSTDALNTNTGNIQGPGKGGCHPRDNHCHYYHHHHHHHHSNFHVRYNLVVVGGVFIILVECVAAGPSYSSSYSSSVISSVLGLLGSETKWTVADITAATTYSSA